MEVSWLVKYFRHTKIIIMNAWEPWSSLRNNRWMNLKAHVTVLPPAHPWVFPSVAASIVTPSLTASHLLSSPKITFRLILKGTCRSGLLWVAGASSAGGSSPPVPGPMYVLPALLAVNVLPMPTRGPCWGPDPGRRCQGWV